jgi:ATP-dependent helicase/nuclease subunit A
MPGQGVETGTIDLLYRDPRGWHLIDFKTEELTGEQDLENALRKYRQQMQRYRQAARELLGPLVSVRLCFLDFQRRVELVDQTRS